MSCWYGALWSAVLKWELGRSLSDNQESERKDEPTKHRPMAVGGGLFSAHYRRPRGPLRGQDQGGGALRGGPAGVGGAACCPCFLRGAGNVHDHHGCDHASAAYVNGKYLAARNGDNGSGNVHDFHDYD